MAVRKVPGLHFTPCCRKGSRQALRSDFTPLPRAPPLGELDAVRRPERARMRTRSCALGLALPCGSAALSEARSKPRLCAAVRGLALSVIASRCHLSQSERPWQSAKFPGLYFTPCCHKKSRQALRVDFPPLPRALPLGELDAKRPERAETLTVPRLHGGSHGRKRSLPQAGLPHG